MALSDNASLCLTSFIHRLAEIDHTEEDYKELIQHTLLESLRRGLKSKTEVRHCYLMTYIRVSWDSRASENFRDESFEFLLEIILYWVYVARPR